MRATLRSCAPAGRAACAGVRGALLPTAPRLPLQLHTFTFAGPLQLFHMIYNVVEERAKARKGSYTRPAIILLHSLHVVHRSNPKWCVELGGTTGVGLAWGAGAWGAVDVGTKVRHGHLSVRLTRHALSR